MYRGTTPTITFTLPLDCGRITALNLCFVQQEQIVLEKNLQDCAINENALSVMLTEAETLLFDSKKGMVEMQLRIGCGATRMASNIMRLSVDRILKDGCLE